MTKTTIAYCAALFLSAVGLQGANPIPPYPETRNRLRLLSQTRSRRVLARELAATAYRGARSALESR